MHLLVAAYVFAFMCLGMSFWFCPECGCGAISCSGCTGTAPSTMSVTLTGMANSDCSDCTDMNATFASVPWEGAFGDICRWKQENIACFYDLTVSIGPSGGNNIVNVLLYRAVDEYVIYEDDLGSTDPIDCTANRSVTLDSYNFGGIFGSDCDTTGAGNLSCTLN